MAVVRRTLERRHTILGAWIGQLFTMTVYILALLAIAVAVGHGLTRGQHWLDDIQHGFPRRVHLSGYVGHGDANGPPTHFIALNMHSQISILILPGGDVNRLTVLPGPYVVGADGSSVVPQIELHDIDGNQHVDLLVTLRGETVVYLNKDGAFRLATTEERTMLTGQSDGSLR